MTSEPKLLCESTHQEVWIDCQRWRSINTLQPQREVTESCFRSAAYPGSSTGQLMIFFCFPNRSSLTIIISYLISPISLCPRFPLTSTKTIWQHHPLDSLTGQRIWQFEKDPPGWLGHVMVNSRDPWVIWGAANAASWSSLKIPGVSGVMDGHTPAGAGRILAVHNL